MIESINLLLIFYFIKEDIYIKLFLSHIHKYYLISIIVKWTDKFLLFS